MGTLGLLTGMREFLGLVVEMTWRGFGLLLDGLVSLSPLQAGLLLFVFLSLHVGMARRMQSSLNTTLDEDPAAEYVPILLEARHSLVGMVVVAVAGVVMLPFKLVGAIISMFKKGEEKKEEEKKKKPVLVPTLGPSYLWSALIVVGMYVLAVLMEPVIRWQIDAPVHFPTWQYVIFGHRAELGPFLPLQTYPYVGAVVVTSFWVTMWWGVARLVRLVQWNVMGVNLLESADDEGVLASWREYFGVTNLAELDDSFVVWAKWLPWVALPFVVMAFVGLGGDPYRVSTSAFGVAVVVWMSWGLQLWLEGVYRPEEEEAAEEERREEATAAGWIDVLNDLRRVHRIGLPALREPIRDVEGLAFSRHRLEGSELISPLLGELLPEPHRLTVMQQNVISSLSRHSFVHLDVPGERRTLNLGSREESGEELRHRNQVVIAPEGSGKTALGMLAAVNTALIHTGSTLVLARNKESARRLGRTFEGMVEPSTLRWNVRVRQIGGELVEDLAQGILPDLLVCDLQELVTVLLEDVETYRPFFMNLGLIVIDDVETFCGPVEVHAQLAMRRLKLRLKSVQGGEVEGSEDEEGGPIFLVLAGDTMDELPTWVRSLCGIDAVSRTFGSQGDARRGEMARQARRDVDAGGRTVGEEDEQVKTQDGRERKQLIYDLASFGREEKRLSVVEIVEACEALAVPWHYRACGDERRLLGRSVLALKNEPQSYVEDPLRAAVVFLDGHATAVEREIKRLGRAGALFTSRSAPLEAEEELEEGEELAGGEDREGAEQGEEAPEGGIDTESMEPIALIAVVDQDESRVLETVDGVEGLRDLVERLPRPFLRPPSGHLIKRHLTSELVQHWTEVAELLEVFGNGIAGDLRELVRQGAVLQDARRTLEPGKRNYEERVYLRGLEAEILGDGKGAGGASWRLPPPVEDVEVASRRNVSLRERTTLAELGKVDAESARHRFYRGRIFETVRGRHVVVGYAGSEAAKEGAFEVGDVIVEPFLGEEVSSPRRQVRMEFYRGDGFEPEPMYLGEYPFGVSLMPVTCRVEEIGVFRLERTTGEVRQRIYRSEKERGEEVSLRTKALGIYPNVVAKKRGGEAPVLRLMGARLIGAAMRLVTPLIYRGAEAAVGIGLCVEREEAAWEYELGAAEGFYFYDLHGGGNGASQAIQRDGIEPILNLVMHLLEEVADPRRLLAKYDEWDGVMSEEAGRLAREEALRWLGSRLKFGEESGEEEEEAVEVSR